MTVNVWCQNDKIRVKRAENEVKQSNIVYHIVKARTFVILLAMHFLLPVIRFECVFMFTLIDLGSTRVIPGC